MGIIRVVRDPHNLSHSRLNFTACPARAGYEWAYKEPRVTASPYWLVGGAAVHDAIDTILTKTVVVGKLLALDEVEPAVESAKKHIYAALKGFVPPKGHDATKIKDIYWMNEERKANFTPESLEKHINGEISKYINKCAPAIYAIALRCTQPSPYIATNTEVRDQLSLTSARDPKIKIPVYLIIDLVEQFGPTHNHPHGGFIIRDWKTGNFSHFMQDQLEGNEQMLIYWPSVNQIYGAYPTAGFFQSLNIFKSDVDEHGIKALELPQYRVRAMIRFEEQFPELVRLYSDIWDVLNFLAYPAQSAAEEKERKDWQPCSAIGIKSGLKQIVDQNRLIPKIGKWCGMCPARPLCQADNPEDWEEHDSLQRLGNVAGEQPLMPEDWINPMAEDCSGNGTVLFPEVDTLVFSEQLRLFSKRDVRLKLPAKNKKLSTKEWRAKGFFNYKERVALERKMMSIIPPIAGETCPCKKSGRINPVLCDPDIIHRFETEREAYKCAQEAEGKKRSGEGDEKVKDIFDSQVVREALENCTVEGCPFAKRKEQIKPQEEPKTEQEDEIPF